MGVLEWLVSNGYRVNGHTCIMATSGGQLETLQWLRGEANCSWDIKSVCETAAKAGHLGVLKWVRPQGLGLDDSEVYMLAESAGHVHVLVWLIESGYSEPVPRDACDGGSGECDHCAELSLGYYCAETQLGLKTRGVFPAWYCVWCPVDTLKSECTIDHETRVVDLLLAGGVCKDVAKIVARMACV